MLMGCLGFPDSIIQKFVGLTKFTFHVFGRYDINIQDLGDVIASTCCVVLYFRRCANAKAHEMPGARS